MMKTNWTEQDVPKQDGRIAIVTGANSGIGFETARVLAARGATVIMACRNPQRGQAAVKLLKDAHPDYLVEFIPLDLSSLESIQAFASTFKSLYNRLDLLVNNAGVMVPPYSKTKEGFELQFGTNHLGHFALTGLLIELMENTENSRIVNVSSMAHKAGKLNFSDLNWESRSYKPWQAYGDSKIANLYFTFELQRRLQENGHEIKVTAAHPGWTETGLQRNAGVTRFLNKFFAQKPQAGAWPTLMAAVDESATGGEYYGPSGFMEMNGNPKKVSTNKLAQDKAIASKLWQVSEQATGVAYSI